MNFIKYKKIIISGTIILLVFWIFYYARVNYRANKNCKNVVKYSTSKDSYSWSKGYYYDNRWKFSSRRSYEKTREDALKECERYHKQYFRGILFDFSN